MNGDDEKPDDDQNITDDEVLLRRIFPGRSKIDAQGDFKIPSDAFRDSRGPCSVDRMVDDQQPARCLEGHEGFGLAAITAANVRAEGFGVVADPIDGNPNHALITGSQKSSRRKKLVKHAYWIKEPRPKDNNQ